MRWHIADWRDETDGGQYWVDANDHYKAPYSRDENPRWRWSPSTDIAAAWQVDRPGWVWEFQETSHDLTATLYPSPEARSEAIASWPVLPKGVALVRREWGDDKASTYAWVRCLAALRAVGVEAE